MRVGTRLTDRPLVTGLVLGVSTAFFSAFSGLTRSPGGRRAFNTIEAPGQGLGQGVRNARTVTNKKIINAIMAEFSSDPKVKSKGRVGMRKMSKDQLIDFWIGRKISHDLAIWEKTGRIITGTGFSHPRSYAMAQNIIRAKALSMSRSKFGVA